MKKKKIACPTCQNLAIPFAFSAHCPTCDGAKFIWVNEDEDPDREETSQNSPTDLGGGRSGFGITLDLDDVDPQIPT